MSNPEGGPDGTRPPATERPDFTPPGGGPPPDDATQVIPGSQGGPRPEHGPEWSATGTTVQPMAAPAAERSKPRSRTVMIAVISVLAVLALLIAGDRIANSVAENAIGGQLQSELSTPAKPEVSIGGFPFVTQVLSGSFSSARVTADDATVTSGEATVAIAHLDATLTGITATDRYSTIVADRGEATALVGWAGVSALAGHQVSYVADDRMQISFSVPIGRLSIDGHITGRPELDVDAQTVTVADPQVSVASVDVPQAVVDAVSRIVLQPFPIEDLPYDIQLTGLAVQPDGVALSGNGHDIPLRSR